MSEYVEHVRELRKKPYHERSPAEQEIVNRQDLLDKIEALRVEADELEGIMSLFQDVRLTTVRRRKSILVSRCATPRCDTIEFGDTCSCCDDAAVEVAVYCEFYGRRIYANSVSYTVMRRVARDRYDVPEDPEWWVKRMREDGVDEGVICRVREEVKRRLDAQAKEDVDDGEVE